MMVESGRYNSKLNMYQKDSQEYQNLLKEKEEAMNRHLVKIQGINNQINKNIELRDQKQSKIGSTTKDSVLAEQRAAEEKARKEEEERRRKAAEEEAKRRAELEKSLNRGSSKRTPFEQAEREYENWLKMGGALKTAAEQLEKYKALTLNKPSGDKKNDEEADRAEKIRELTQAVANEREAIALANAQREVAIGKMSEKALLETELNLLNERSKNYAKGTRQYAEAELKKVQLHKQIQQAEEQIAQINAQIQLEKGEITQRQLLEFQLKTLEEKSKGYAKDTQLFAEAEQQKINLKKQIEQVDLAEATSKASIALENTKLTAKERYDIQKELVEKELQLTGLSQQRKDELNQRLKELERQYSDEVLSEARRKREVKLNYLDMEMSDIDYALEQGIISEKEASKRKEVIIRQRAELERQTLNDQLQRAREVYGEQSVEYQLVAQQIEQLNRNLTRKLEANTVSFAKSFKQAFRDMTKDMEDSIADVTKQLLQKTTSWKQAFKDVSNSMLDSLAGSLSKYIATQTTEMAKAVVKWIAQRAKMTMFHQTATAMETSTTVSGEAAQTAAKEAGTATRIAKTAAETGAAIAGSTAGASASIAATSASFSAIWAAIMTTAKSILSIPIVGWAIGAAMLAGVVSAVNSWKGAKSSAQAQISSASVASFDVGTWRVPTDMLAQVHKGEVIVPEKFSDKARQVLSGEAPAGTGRGDNFNVNISSPDAKSVQRLFDRNGKAMVKALKKQKRNFAF